MPSNIMTFPPPNASFIRDASITLNFPNTQQPIAAFELGNAYPEDTRLRVYGAMSGSGELKAKAGETLVSLGTGTTSFDEEIELQAEGDVLEFISDDFVGIVTSFNIDLQD